MKIRITNSVGIDGKRVKPGTVVETPFVLGKSLIARECAVEVTDDEAAEVVTESGPTFLAETATSSEAPTPPANTPKASK